MTAFALFGAGRHPGGGGRGPPSPFASKLISQFTGPLFVFVKVAGSKVP